jgi:hypothetical protein
VNPASLHSRNLLTVSYSAGCSEKLGFSTTRDLASVCLSVCIHMTFHRFVVATITQAQITEQKMHLI